MTDSETVPLKEYIETRLNYLEKIQDEREQSSKEALNLARKESDIHFDKLNGEYSRIDKVIASTLPREVYQTQHDNLCNRVKDLELNRAELSGKANQSSVDKAMILSFISVAIAIIGFIIGLFGR